MRVILPLLYPDITPEDIEACIRYKAAGAKLSNYAWADLNAWMDEYDAKRERKEMARLRKLAAEWDARTDKDGPVHHPVIQGKDNAPYSHRLYVPGASTP